MLLRKVEIQIWWYIVEEKVSRVVNPAMWDLAAIPSKMCSLFKYISHTHV